MRSRQPTRRIALVLVSVAVLSAMGVQGVQASPMPAGEGAAAPGTARGCADLAGERFEVLDGVGVHIQSATPTAARGGLPGHCRATGVVAPRIEFEVRLPSDWNGKYFQTGCGGFCGFIPIGSCNDALGRHYAVAAENSGHRGSVFDGRWALDNRQAEIDWGYRSPHVVAAAAKEIISRYYGRPPGYSYFQGCSTGGRQALMEAQRYPEDFDGIIAGAPANRQNYLATLAQSHLERVNRDASGDVILTLDKLPLLSDAVMAACDEIDGRADNVLDDPRQCDFDPGVLECRPGQDPAACLTHAQVEVVRGFYDSVRDSKGRALYPGGLPRGSELGWGAGQGSIGTDEELSGAGKYANQVFRYLAFEKDPGSGYDLFDFDYDRDVAKLDRMAEIYNSDDPDMRRFRDSGGKLILWHGWADPLITAFGTIDYYEQAVKVSGGLAATQRWFRLFLLPGVWHCGGGPGADQVDWLSALEAWVERGQAPGSVTAQRRDDAGQLLDQRTILPYPAPPR